MNIKAKVLAGASGALAAGTLLALAVSSAASASTTAIAVPADLPTAAINLAGLQITDPGTEALVVLAVGLPLAFWLISRAISLIPGRHSRTR